MKKIIIGVSAGIVVLGIVIAITLVSRNREVMENVPKVFYLDEAKAALEEGDLLKAQQLYKTAKGEIEDVNILDEVQKKIETINIEIIFSPILDECSTTYEVQPKDTLIKIAKKFNTTTALIKRANGLSSDTIRLGKKLKVNTCKFSVVVDKSQNLLFLKRADEVVKIYTVSTGKDNSTPTGTFVIDENKLKNPTWYRTGAVIPPDSPENILGSRWMGLEIVDNEGEEAKGYGIHGTTEPDQLGKQITLGCVRMRNEDVEELFDIVPRGTEVVIID